MPRARDDGRHHGRHDRVDDGPSPVDGGLSPVDDGPSPVDGGPSPVDAACP
jgi:hypothetical protein